MPVFLGLEKKGLRRGGGVKVGFFLEKITLGMACKKRVFGGFWGYFGPIFEHFLVGFGVKSEPFLVVNLA